MRKALKKRYLESHYTIFILKGLVGILIGLFLFFTSHDDFRLLSALVGLTLVIFGSSECVNIVQRRKSNSSAAVPIFIMLIEVTLGILMLSPKIGEHLIPVVTILAGYMVLRGLFEIISAIKNLSDKTARFMWLVAGTVGVILGIVVFTYPAADNFTVFRFVGTYFIIYGLIKLIYSVYRKSILLTPKPAPTPIKKATETAKKPVKKRK